MRRKNNLISILQSSTSEKKNSPSLKDKLYHQKTKYTITKNALSTSNTFGSGNNSVLLKTLLRKTNSVSNGQFGRRKYKKLKKIY